MHLRKGILREVAEVHWPWRTYPCHRRSDPKGHWYHHPEAGRCKQGEEVGENGCTWKRAALMHTVSVRELVDAGSIGGQAGARRPVAPEDELRYVKKGLDVFRMAGAAPCGTVPPPLRSGALPIDKFRQRFTKTKTTRPEPPAKSAAASGQGSGKKRSDSLCLPGENMVVTRRAGVLPLEFLEVDAEILTRATTGERVFDRVLGFLHEKQASYGVAASIITLEHALGEFRASPSHLVGVANAVTGQYQTVASIRVGQELLWGASDDEEQAVRVLAVRRDTTQHRLAAPLTASGLLIVDHAASSTYALIAGVAVSHASMHAAFYWRRVHAWSLSCALATLVRPHCSRLSPVRFAWLLSNALLSCSS
eukprot:TRINITY_DN15779_c0_g1_i2.p2 TRINITY_DN15779_c0_g1~~TRINITY_DN15779_c0_g1_i2.p2  ORF type:complete len:365 (-),score=23.98 TRINITY_DN15779_c0_g1_i2:100-1194(-)